jgi:hypothetical protein
MSVLRGACIGLGLLALLSFVKPGWPQRTILAAVYGSVMCILAETIGNADLIPGTRRNAKMIEIGLRGLGIARPRIDLGHGLERQCFDK